MLRTAIVAILGLCVCAACTPKQRADAARRELIGNWKLNMAHNCAYGPVISDIMQLREDGGLEQSVLLQSGAKLDSDRGHWSFIPPSNVGLESHWSFPQNATAPVRESTSLIVEFHRSGNPVILINPDSNCFYEKVTIGSP